MTCTVFYACAAVDRRGRWLELFGCRVPGEAGGCETMVMRALFAHAGACKVECRSLIKAKQARIEGLIRRRGVWRRAFDQAVVVCFRIDVLTQVALAFHTFMFVLMVMGLEWLESGMPMIMRSRSRAWFII